MREYEKDRLIADDLYQIRRDEVYFSVPRIKEIDGELMRLGIDISKRILNENGGGESLLAELRQNNDSLIKEKYDLMKQYDYKEDYLTDIFRCRACKDTGFIGNERCKCLKQRLINQYYELSNLSNILRDENFDTFDLNYYPEEVDPTTGISPRANMRKIYMNCLNFTANFDTEFQNMLLYGSTALGKTFLCNCIAKELLDKGKNVIYLTSSKLFRLVEDLRFNRDEEDDPDTYLEMVFNSDLLILDDLGTELLTVVTAAELFNIINTRFLERKATIISTNLSPGDFEKYYSDRITSRLLGNYALLRFIGNDIRLKKKYGV
jgi:DNA replication protein DnaC